MPGTESPRSSLDRLLVVLDSGSHINGHDQRPGSEQRERPVGCNVRFDDSTQRLPKMYPTNVPNSTPIDVSNFPK